MINVSASSVKLARGCLRRFHGEKVLKMVPRTETEATNLGKKVHEELENWTKHGTLPTSTIGSKLLGSLSKLTHPPMPGLAEAEGGFEFTSGGVTLMGYVDWRRTGDEPGHMFVGDFKTSSSLQYALKYEDGLLVDPEGNVDVQAVIYAAREFLAGAKRVTAVWSYVGTKAPHTTRLVTGDMCETKVRHHLALAVDTGRIMRVLDTVRPDLNDVPFNPGYCHAFRRQCDLHAQCKQGDGGMFSAPNPLDVTQGDHVMLDFLTAIKQSASIDAPPPPPPADDDAPPPPPADEVHPAELIAQAAVAQPATRAVETVEAGFVNPPEAAGKVPYATPAEAAEGEGAVAPAPKAPKAAKGRSKTKVTLDEPVGGGLTLGDAIAEMRQAPAQVVVPKGCGSAVVVGEMSECLTTMFERGASADDMVRAGAYVVAPAHLAQMSKADETLKAMYLLLQKHFED